MTSASANCTVTATSSTPALSDTVAVGSGSYTSKQTVSMTSTVFAGSTPASGAGVTFTVTKPNGTKVSGTATTTLNGTAAWSYKFGPKDPSGAYSVSSTANYQSHTATSNTVIFTMQ